MLKKLSLIVIVWSVLVYSFSSGCSGCKKQVTEICVSIDSLELMAYNNEGREPVSIAANDTIVGEALLLQFKVYDSTTVGLCLAPVGNPFVTSAYAFTKKSNNRFHYKDSITHVYLIADNGFDTQHPAGAELNEYFKMPAPTDYLDGNLNRVYEFYALRSPQQAGVYTFTVKMEFASGNVMEASTEPLNLKP